ncbi:hypothetical protein [Mycolicibacterium septicum]|uniref:hypothetical protein n=1 Tax=Mycolicibacterium septicum TaxID=98668 RepID=UPI00235DE4E5|nr:hypothetical protein [Mycolicibacterium septicum]
MTDSELPEVFNHLPLEHRAALLANPHGALPGPLAEKLVGHIYTAHWVNAPNNTRRWRLRPSEATALEDERLRLDQWWERRSESERAALIEHRGGPLPGELRDAVKDHMPGGVVLGDDLTGPFTMPPLMVTYVEMVARRG